MWFFCRSFLLKSGRNRSRISATKSPTYQPLICECECVYAIDASSAWFFIANCYSFVFASSTLYRIIMLRLVLRFSLLDLRSGWLLFPSRPLSLSALLMCGLHQHTYVFCGLLLTGLDKSVVQLQFKHNVRSFAMPLIPICTLWISIRIPIPFRFIFKRTVSPPTVPWFHFSIRKRCLSKCDFFMIYFYQRRPISMFILSFFFVEKWFDLPQNGHTFESNAWLMRPELKIESTRRASHNLSSDDFSTETNITEMA